MIFLKIGMLFVFSTNQNKIPSVGGRWIGLARIFKLMKLESFMIDEFTSTFNFCNINHYKKNPGKL